MVRLNALSAGGVSGNPVLANITFQAVGSLGAMTSLDVVIVTFANTSGNPIPASDVDGTLTIGRVGDVNCDNTVNGVDSLFILQYTVALRSGSNQCPPPANPPSLFLGQCDVNNDMACNGIDSLFILQCTVGIPNVLCPNGIVTGITRNEAVKRARGLHSYRPREGRKPPANGTGAVIAVGSANVNLGGSVQVPLDIQGASNLGVTTVEVRYDSTVVLATACQRDPDGVFDGAVCNRTTPGVVALSAQAAFGVSGDLRLANITFAPVSAPSSGMSALDVVIVLYADTGGQSLPVMDMDGSLTVLGLPPPSPTDTAVPAPTDTAVPAPTDTAVPVPTDTAVPAPTDTAVPVPTDTAVPAPTDTAVPVPTDTAVPAPTDTAVPVPTDTAVPVPTDTAVPVPTDTAVPAPTDTAVPAPTDTAVPVPTDTAVPVPTDTAVPAPTDTAVPVPTDTAVPAPTDTAVPAPTNTRPRGK